MYCIPKSTVWLHSRKYSQDAEEGTHLKKLGAKFLLTDVEESLAQYMRFEKMLKY